MTAEKKRWHTPQLVVLLRGRPEEAVLKPCKASGVTDQRGLGCIRNNTGICKQIGTS